MQGGYQLWWSLHSRDYLPTNSFLQKHTRASSFIFCRLCTFEAMWVCVCIRVDPLARINQCCKCCSPLSLSWPNITHPGFLHVTGLWSPYLCSQQIKQRKKWCKWCSSADFYFTSKFKMNLFTWIVNKAQRTERKYCRRVNYNELDYDGEGKKVWDVTISWHQDRRHHTELSFH